MPITPSFWIRKFWAYWCWEISVFLTIFLFFFLNNNINIPCGAVLFPPTFVAWWDPTGILQPLSGFHLSEFKQKECGDSGSKVISAPWVPWPFTQSICPQPKHLGVRPCMSAQRMGKRGWLKTDESFKFSLCSTVTFNLETFQNLSEVTKWPWEISFFLMWLQI